MDKKVVRCIFIGHDSQRKGWQCCDEQQELLLDSDVLKGVLDSSHIQLSQDVDESEANEDNIDEDVTQNLWQTAIYQQLSEEGELIGAHSPSSLRRLTRIRKQNSKFANAAIVEDGN
ncbi:hypothetical protein KY290_024747 [Solanum tuberosum]|uniref:Uncharacterized protein n=1 Tax=Solanum tuberosum TaxID=4113 RepID=A0ABQ7UTK0_SOLTU|nr:hypothetical protein KY284_023604 [Solanum tuberosum]KAH0754477.1 hypothetical protein KY290_024747 [Solanum tuberosum]